MTNTESTMTPAERLAAIRAGKVPKTRKQINAEAYQRRKLRKVPAAKNIRLDGRTAEQVHLELMRAEQRYEQARLDVAQAQGALAELRARFKAHSARERATADWLALTQEDRDKWLADPAHYVGKFVRAGTSLPEPDRSVWLTMLASFNPSGR
jgi:hypothetical protein